MGTETEETAKEAGLADRTRAKVEALTALGRMENERLLAVQIGALHREIERDPGSRYAEMYKLLTRAKKEAAAGDGWLRWLAKHRKVLGFGERQAQLYLREPEARASDKARHAEGERARRQRVLVRPVPVNPDAAERAPVPVRVEVVDQSRRGADDEHARRALAVRELEAALADAEKLTFTAQWAPRLRAIRNGIDKLIPAGD